MGDALETYRRVVVPDAIPQRRKRWGWTPSEDDKQAAWLERPALTGLKLGSQTLAALYARLPPRR